MSSAPAVADAGAPVGAKGTGATAAMASGIIAVVDSAVRWTLCMSWLHMA